MCTEFVCPTLGYKEFLHADWLNQILSWQKPIGCWGSVSNSRRLADSKQDHRRQSEKKQSVPVNNAGSSQEGVVAGLQPPVFRTRHLLYEKVVSGNHLWCCCVIISICPCCTWSQLRCSYDRSLSRHVQIVEYINVIF